MSKNRNSASKCKKGEILREGYHRRGYHRNEYERKSGVVVSEADIPETDVPAVCVKDTGAPGKGPKTLPNLRDEVHLTKYGYSIHKPDAERHAALLSASRDHDMLETILDPNPK